MVVTKKEVTPNAKITIEGRAIEQVKKFIYLGNLITDNGKYDSEIKRRTEIARGAFSNISKVITSTKISTSTRLRLINVMCGQHFLMVQKPGQYRKHLLEE